MSYREDFFRMLEGKTPVSDVAYYRMGTYAVEGQPNGVVRLQPELANSTPVATTGKNRWGIEHELDFLGTGFIPKPGDFKLKDVTKWKDVVKAPYVENYDFKAEVDRTLATLNFDPKTQILQLSGLGGGYFLQLVSFMGFEGAMIAMAEEPEATFELISYFCDHDCWLVDNYLTHLKGKVDYIGFGDDNATESNPFMSYDMFKKLLLPNYKRVFDVARKHGVIISYHNCGRCEDFMQDFVDIGTQIWNCATPVNDLKAFKEKYDNKIIVELMPRIYPNANEEQTRKQVRDAIDAYAPGGAFIWIGSSSTNNPEGRAVDEWVYDEVSKYGKNFYK